MDNLTAKKFRQSYGEPAPVVKGSVVLDLGLMKKIVEVNDENIYAIVEPGVTFFDLYEYVQKQDLKLWISCPALGWGSVIGNCLDRGIGYTPNGDHSAQCIAGVGMWNYRGPGGHTCFAPIIPPSGRELDIWYNMVKQKIEAAGFDFFADFHVFPRYVLATALVVFAEDEGEKMHKLYLDLVDDGVKMGFSEYRTHVAYVDLVADHYDYNNSALRRYVEQLKDLTDPKGIQAPGKQGVWGNSELVKTYKAAPN